MLRIGVSACFFHSDPTRPIFKGKTLLYAEQSMLNWILNQNVLAYLIPSVDTEIVKDLDGLVLQGGSDVAPETYGSLPLKPEWRGDAIRDQYEIALVKEFIAQKKPVLGVCRGLQLINVAFGGTLYQDIETEVPNTLVHRDWNIYDSNIHDIEIKKGSILSKIHNGINTAKVNSVHHQAIKDLAKPMIVESISIPDGLIEAMRYNGEPFVYGIQWHPEFHSDPSLLSNEPILKEFLRHAQDRKSSN